MIRGLVLLLLSSLVVCQPPPAGQPQPQPGNNNNNNNAPAPSPTPECSPDLSIASRAFFESPRGTDGRIPTFATVGNEMNITWKFSENYNPAFPRTKISLYFVLARDEALKEKWRLITELPPSSTRRTYMWRLPAMADGDYKIRISFDEVDDFMFGPKPCVFEGFPIVGVSQAFRVINAVEIESYPDEFAPNSHALRIPILVAVVCAVAMSLLLL